MDCCIQSSFQSKVKSAFLLEIKVPAEMDDWKQVAACHTWMSVDFKQSCQYKQKGLDRV